MFKSFSKVVAEVVGSFPLGCTGLVSLSGHLGVVCQPDSSAQWLRRTVEQRERARVGGREERREGGSSQKPLPQ